MWREFLAAVWVMSAKSPSFGRRGRDGRVGRGVGRGTEGGRGRRGAGGDGTAGRPEVRIRHVSEVRPAPKLMR